jgi:hypothetical protein
LCLACFPDENHMMCVLIIFVIVRRQAGFTATIIE